MRLCIVKRNGDIKPFEKEKIVVAISKAAEGEEVPLYAYAIADKIEQDAVEKLEKTIGENASENFLTVEEIQDKVEKLLMDFDKGAAKEYIKYRYQRETVRKNSTRFISAIAEKLNGEKIENSNANVDEASFGGRVGEATSVMMRDYALNHCMSEMSKQNHLNNYIYIHDLNAYAVGQHNCLSLPIDDLLAKGFKTRQVDIRPAGSINTAFQLVAVLFQLQSLMQFGGVAATHLDWTMVPYVRKSFFKHYKDGVKYFDGREELDYSFHPDLSIEEEDYKVYSPKAYKYAMDQTEKELGQAVEGLYHNLNSLQSRSGNQLPFTSINYGTCQLPEGRMVIRALLEGSIEGVGKYHRTPIFPCSIFQCMKGVNRKPGDPNYDLFQLALKSTSQRLYPNYANCDWSVNEGYDKNDPRQYVSTMGCRTYNGYDINGLGFQKDGRGNIAPVTIILPTLAMEAKIECEKEGQDEDVYVVFRAKLIRKLNEAKDMLLERYKLICSQPMEAAKFMYENNTMAGYIPEEGIESALKHGTLAIGFLGIAETLQILIGCDQTEEKGLEVAKDILQLYNATCKKFKEKYKLNFGVYSTPAESLCGTALNKFRKRFGVIPNVSDRDFFTNSLHCPVWKELSPFDKIDIEAQLACYTNAGNITYVELPSGVKNNIQALEELVNYAMDKDIPYFAINVPVDDCLDCGYSGEFNDKCPQCDSENIQQLRRVTGYLSTTWKHFNHAKQEEVAYRVKHSH